MATDSVNPALVGRVTLCAPPPANSSNITHQSDYVHAKADSKKQPSVRPDGAHGVTRPTHHNRHHGITENTAVFLWVRESPRGWY